MPVPTSLADLSTTAGSNSPSGSESSTTADDYLRTHAAFLALLRDGAGNPSGTLLPYAGTTAPTGYLLCNGSAVSRTTYAALFAVIGTTYGVGDGVSTFNVPNSVDRMLMGAGGIYANGATGGSKDAAVVAHTHTYSGTSGNESATHTHAVTDPGHAHTVTRSTYWGSASTGNVGWSGDDASAPAGSVAVATSSNTTGITLGNASATHTHAYSGTTASTGVAATDANLPPYLGVRFIIKT